MFLKRWHRKFVGDHRRDDTMIRRNVTAFLVITATGFGLLAADAAIAAQWERLVEDGPDTMCLDASSVEPGPSNYTQFVWGYCDALGKLGYSGVGRAVECAAVRRRDAEIRLMAYFSGAWEIMEVPVPLASGLGKALQVVCNIAQR
jgi:hypothetical protein